MVGVPQTATAKDKCLDDDGWYTLCSEVSGYVAASMRLWQCRLQEAHPYIGLVAIGLCLPWRLIPHGSKLGFQTNSLAALIHWGSIWCIPTSVYQTKKISKEC